MKDFLHNKMLTVLESAVENIIFFLTWCIPFMHTWVTSFLLTFQNCQHFIVQKVLHGLQVNLS